MLVFLHVKVKSLILHYVLGLGTMTGLVPIGAYCIHIELIQENFV